MKWDSDDHGYDDVDAMLNAVMQSQSDLGRARERLRVITAEAEEAKKK